MTLQLTNRHSYAIHTQVSASLTAFHVLLYVVHTNTQLVYVVHPFLGSYRLVWVHRITVYTSMSHRAFCLIVRSEQIRPLGKNYDCMRLRSFCVDMTFDFESTLLMDCFPCFNGINGSHKGRGLHTLLI